MNDNSRYIRFMLYVSILVYCVACFCLGYYRRSVLPKMAEQLDTIVRVDTVYKRDTMTLTKTDIEVHCVGSRLKETITDTLKLAKNDTITDTIPQYVNVEIPIEEREYKDSLYYVKISGFQPKLDSLSVFPRTTTIIKEKTLREPKNKQKWGVGLNASYSYDIHNNKLIPTVGVGIQYNIFKW